MALMQNKKQPATSGTGLPASKTLANVDVQKNSTEKINVRQVKKRNWTCVVYPESLPENWKDILRESGLQIAISPLHDKDVNPDGTIKKAHYHLILIYSGPTSYNVVLALTQRLNAPIPKSLEAVRGMYRYFTHKDNPEKFQYDEKEIECLNGFSILDFCDLTRNEVLQIKKKLVDLIKEKKLCEYSTFIDLVIENYTDMEFDVASSHTIFFDKYLTSIRHHQQGDAKTLVEEALNRM